MKWMSRVAALGFLVWLALIVGFALTGCATTSEPQVIVQKVEVPVAVKCAADPGPEPSYSDSAEAIRAAADLFEKVKLLLAGRAERDARLAELRAANAGCR